MASSKRSPSNTSGHPLATKCVPWREGPCSTPRPAEAQVLDSYVLRNYVAASREGNPRALDLTKPKGNGSKHLYFFQTVIEPLTGSLVGVDGV